MTNARLLRSARRVHRRVLYPILAALLPADCFGCGRPLGAVHLLGACPGCWSSLRPIRAPLCPSCGEPHPRGTDLLGVAGGRCASCVLRPLDLDALRVAVAYDGLARRFLLRAKFAGRPEILHHLGQQLAQVIGDSGLGASCTLATAVPAHPWVRWRRGFNPALEIARPIALGLGLPLRQRLLYRRWRHGAAAKRMTASGRRTALRGAFGCRGGLRGERVLLVDDVVTTGATAESCSRALRRAGASFVCLAGWARTPRAAPGAGDLDRGPS